MKLSLGCRLSSLKPEFFHAPLSFIVLTCPPCSSQRYCPHAQSRIIYYSQVPPIALSMPYMLSRGNTPASTFYDEEKMSRFFSEAEIFFPAKRRLRRGNLVISPSSPPPPLSQWWKNPTTGHLNNTSLRWRLGCSAASRGLSNLDLWRMLSWLRAIEVQAVHKDGERRRESCGAVAKQPVGFKLHQRLQGRNKSAFNPHWFWPQISITISL